MGLLDSVLGGARSSGGMSPITMAMLGVLAYRTFQGKGRLADMLGRGRPPVLPAARAPPTRATGSAACSAGSWAEDQSAAF
jgi:hypothetical protein